MPKLALFYINKESRVLYNKDTLVLVVREIKRRLISEILINWRFARALPRTPFSLLSVIVLTTFIRG